MGFDSDHIRTVSQLAVQVNQVEVYPSSGVFCEMRSWHAANQTQSPTAMARTLLLGVFDMDTLLNSNLRGGRSRRPTFPNHRTALDPHKLNAIYSMCVIDTFPDQQPYEQPSTTFHCIFLPSSLDHSLISENNTLTFSIIRKISNWYG